MLKEKLDQNISLRKHLYEKGYLITNTEIEYLQDYPFYSNWNHSIVGKYHFYVYNTVKLYTYTALDNTYFLIGHAYNPYTMDYEEEVILKKIAEADDRLDIINELTGIFILGTINQEGISFMLDASGMQYGCYGLVNGNLFITSHMRLIGDLCDIEEDEYVTRLVNYRWYHYMMGNYLPGDLTCYKEVKRIIPNTFVTYQNNVFKVTRFYPCKEIPMCKNGDEYAAVIKESARILKNTMKLIPMKWEKPAISLTGGIDSNTTFAAANGVYDQYRTFSYISMYRESVDAEKAREISEHFKVDHDEYVVPENNDEIPDFEIYKELFERNGGDIGSYKDNDARKKITSILKADCDVEVKSWISETIRAYAYKYFGRDKFPDDLSPRDYTSLYKIFFMNRKLVHETDEHFRQYIENTDLKAHLYNYDESDFFVWEMMHGGKCGLDIGVMKSCFDITIPYNNRKLLDTLLRIPLQFRLSDQHHLSLKEYMNKELYEMNIRVVNLNETDRRKKMANIYYTVNTHLPF